MYSGYFYNLPSCPQVWSLTSSRALFVVWQPRLAVLAREAMARLGLPLVVSRGLPPSLAHLGEPAPGPRPQGGVPGGRPGVASPSQGARGEARVTGGAVSKAQGGGRSGFRQGGDEETDTDPDDPGEAKDQEKKLPIKNSQPVVPALSFLPQPSPSLPAPFSVSPRLAFPCPGSLRCTKQLVICGPR